MMCSESYSQAALTLVAKSPPFSRLEIPSEEAHAAPLQDYRAAIVQALQSLTSFSMELLSGSGLIL